MSLTINRKPRIKYELYAKDLVWGQIYEVSDGLLYVAAQPQGTNILAVGIGNDCYIDNDIEGEHITFREVDVTITIAH